MFRLTQGPRVKGYATCHLEGAVLTLLNDWKSTQVALSERGDLEVIGKSGIFNISQILYFQPDFEQVSLSNKVLNSYLSIIQCDERVKKWIKNLSTQPSYGLHAAEQVAIHLYTTKKFKRYQAFLRTPNQILRALKKAHPLSLKQEVSELLLTSVIASHGLAKPIPFIDLKEQRQLLSLYRAEFFRKNSKIRKNYIEVSKEGGVIRHPGFTSTSLLKKTFDHGLPGLNFSKHNIFITYKQFYSSGSLGKAIFFISNFPKQEEILFPPGTQFHYTNYRETSDGKLYLDGEVVRTIDGCDPYAYSPLKITEIELSNCYFSLNQLYGRFYALLNQLGKWELLSFFSSLRNQLRTTLVSNQINRELNGSHLLELLEGVKHLKTSVYTASFKDSQEDSRNILERVECRLTYLSTLNIETQGIKPAIHRKPFFLIEMNALGGTDYSKQLSKIVYEIYSLEDFIHAIEYIPNENKLSIFESFRKKIVRLSCDMTLFMKVIRDFDATFKEIFFQTFKNDLANATIVPLDFRNFLGRLNQSQRRSFLSLYLKNKSFQDIECGQDLNQLLIDLKCEEQKDLLEAYEYNKVREIMETATDYNWVIKAIHPDLLAFFMKKFPLNLLGLEDFILLSRNIPDKKFAVLIQIYQPMLNSLIKHHAVFFRLAHAFNAKRFSQFINVVENTSEIVQKDFFSTP